MSYEITSSVNGSSLVNHFKVKSNATGQGAATPKESVWSSHAVVEYNGSIYDPSYGEKYGSVANALSMFISTSVESIGRSTSIAPDETLTYWYGNIYTVVTVNFDLPANNYFILI